MGDTPQIHSFVGLPVLGGEMYADLIKEWLLNTPFNQTTESTKNLSGSFYLFESQSDSTQLLVEMNQQTTQIPN